MADLLQSLLVCELIRPSSKLWLVSPWITDIVVVDNAAGQFKSLIPEFKRAPIRLSEILVLLADKGTRVQVCTRDDEKNRPFISKLGASAGRLAHCLRVTTSTELHEKGLLCDSFYLNGSFNFTVRGLTKGEELASLIRTPERIAQAHIDFSDWWPW